MRAHILTLQATGGSEDVITELMHSIDRMERQINQQTGAPYAGPSPKPAAARRPAARKGRKRTQSAQVRGAHTLPRSYRAG